MASFGNQINLHPAFFVDILYGGAASFRRLRKVRSTAKTGVRRRNLLSSRGIEMDLRKIEIAANSVAAGQNRGDG